MSRWLRDRLRPTRPTVVGIDGRSARWRNGSVIASGPAEEAIGSLGGEPLARQWLLVAGLDLAVHWMQAPPRGVASFTELRQAAAARCAQLHGGEPGDWWVAGDWALHREFVCAALPGEIALAWTDAAHARRVSLRMETTWTAACAVAPQRWPDAGWAGLATSRHAVTWHVTQGHVNCVLDVPLGPAGTAEAARQRVAPAIRLARLRLPHLSQGPIHWGGTDAPLPPTEAEVAFSWGEQLVGASA